MPKNKKTTLRKKNKNITPLKNLSELKNEILFTNFELKKEFHLLCKLRPNSKLEKLELMPINTDKIDQKGLVYVFVIKGKIFKIGHTINSIKDRIQSYNCGKTEYRINGTNSTTNYFVLQSFLNLNEIVEVYAFFPKQPKYILFNKTYQDSYPPSKKAENIILKNFIKKHDKKPIGCTQK
ncbi:MAG: GIY-YIG nuclease family protein [Alphaproteobacteria bacterium]|nr:GIY-YIG nuclease family protein [Alphaproteobacteria bacterium]